MCLAQVCFYLVPIPGFFLHRGILEFFELRIKIAIQILSECLIVINQTTVEHSEHKFNIMSLTAVNFHFIHSPYILLTFIFTAGDWAWTLDNGVCDGWHENSQSFSGCVVWLHHWRVVQQQQKQLGVVQTVRKLLIKNGKWAQRQNKVCR